MKKTNKEEKKKYNESIPVEIRSLFGKFYIFSILIIIFFFGLYPFVIINYVSMFTKIALLIVIFVLFILMIIDVFKKKKTFSSSLFIFLIIISIMSMIFSLIKLIY